MRNVTRVSVALSALTLTTACGGFGPFGRCEEGASISDRALVEIAVRKIVGSSQSPDYPEFVRYRSVADFFERNPDCCFVTRPDNYAGGGFSLPLDGEIEIAIRYRHTQTGDKPYRLRHVAIGPCPTHMEESDQHLTAAEYEASKNWRWNWRVR